MIAVAARKHRLYGDFGKPMPGVAAKYNAGTEPKYPRSAPEWINQQKGTPGRAMKYNETRDGWYANKVNTNYEEA